MIGILAISSLQGADMVFAPDNGTDTDTNETIVNPSNNTNSSDNSSNTTNNTNNSSNNTNSSDNSSNNTNNTNSSNTTNSSNEYARIIISVTTDKSTYSVGDIITYRVRIQNTGNVDLSNVNIAALLPEGIEFIGTSTGITRNDYNSGMGVWAVNNLRLEAHGGFNDASITGTKEITITARVTPEMAGKSFNLNAHVISAMGSNGQSAAGASATSFFSVNPSSDSSNSIGSGNGSGDSNETTNSTKSGNNPLEEENNTQKGANHTNAGEDAFESTNIQDNLNSGDGLLDLISRQSNGSVYSNDSNTSLGGMITEAIDSSNPSSDKPMYELRDLSESGSDSSDVVGTESIIQVIIAVALSVVTIAGYFYGVRHG